MNTKVKDIIVSLISSTLSVLLFNLVSYSQMLKLVEQYQGFIVIIQALLALTNFIFCYNIVNICKSFVLKHKQEDIRTETVDVVYNLVGILLYIGIAIIVGNEIWGKMLTTQRDLFLAGTIEIGPITREVIVFFKWVFGFYINFTFGIHLYKILNSELSLLEQLKNTKRSDVLLELYATTVIGLLAFL